MRQSTCLPAAGKSIGRPPKPPRPPHTTLVPSASRSSVPHCCGRWIVIEFDQSPGGRPLRTWAVGRVGETHQVPVAYVTRPRLGLDVHTSLVSLWE